MRDQTLLYWGMVVTIFILIAGMLTARELIEMHFEKRREALQKKSKQGSDAT